jgi:predicted DsbA family dithiol-disulfide isomerase
MSDVCVRITEFTDPGCPWAFSAEPFRRRLNWLYEGRLEWIPRMVVLSDRAEDNDAKGLTPPKYTASLKRIAHDHRMPIDTGERERVPGTRPACEAVVAARLHAGERATRLLLRNLRVRNFAGELLDEQAALDAAAGDAGLDPADVAAWRGEPSVAEAVAEDMRLAREPMPAARVLDAKLANWSGGRRYTCPSYEITRLSDGVTISIPGFQPFAAYDVVLANLVPGLERRDAPGSVEEVLRWAGTPLASQEVAVVCDVPFEEARQELGRVAQERHVGADGYWTL